MNVQSSFPLPAVFWIFNA